MTRSVLRREGSVLREPQSVPDVVVWRRSDLLARYRVTVPVRATRSGIPIMRKRRRKGECQSDSGGDKCEADHMNTQKQNPIPAIEPVREPKKAKRKRGMVNP